MRHILLLYTLLCTVSANYGMETEESVKKNSEIYTSFKNHPPEAKNIIPRNSRELTSLFEYGLQKNDPDFIQWLLLTKRPLCDEPCVQETYKHSSNSAITLVLVNYMTAEKNKNERDLKKVQKQEENATSTDDGSCRCTIS